MGLAGRGDTPAPGWLFYPITDRGLLQKTKKAGSALQRAPTSSSETDGVAFAEVSTMRSQPHRRFCIAAPIIYMRSCEEITYFNNSMPVSLEDWLIRQ